MSVMLDLIGSTIIGAYVILMGIQLNTNIIAHTDSSNANLNVQESLVNVVRTIEYDFRKIGYGVVDPKMSIEISSPTAIRFQGDIDRDGTIDKIAWFIAPYKNGTDTVFALFRRVNTQTPLVMSIGVKDFNLRYLRENGTPADTTAKSQIWIIETTLNVESPYEVADDILGYDKMSTIKGFWRQTRLASRNIKRHG
ncbi:MAG TPA: hypothetical protein VGB89_14130 [Bacteroidota bacterium]